MNSIYALSERLVLVDSNPVMIDTEGNKTVVSMVKIMRKATTDEKQMFDMRKRDTTPVDLLKFRLEKPNLTLVSCFR